MSKVLAIINTRVSTVEQLQNNSLKRQLDSTLAAAKRLGAVIPHDGRWSGSVSSKAGTNVKRKDLLEMLEYCKTHKDVKYAIFDEYDRYMRSINEGPYFEVLFQELGVKVWYASESDSFNGDDAIAKLMRVMSAFKAEGSNEERQRKSINGQTQAVKEGRYPFHPKPGYMKGPEPGIHIPEPGTFEPLQKAFKEVSSGLYSPQDALRRLNKSSFRKIHATWRMDRFSEFACDPYYAGILEVTKQVKARNEHGLHEPMLGLDEHYVLVEKFTGRAKPRGPRNQYNPLFPMSKILTCGDCGDTKFTGSRKNNGYSRKVTRYYERYSCRGCHKQYDRKLVHGKIMKMLDDTRYTGAQQQEFIKALETVWQEKKKDRIKELESLYQDIRTLEQEKSGLIREVVKVELEYKQDILIEVDNIKQRITEVQKQVADLGDLDKNMADFVEFGLHYTDRLMENWWQLSHEDRVRGQQLIFPGGIFFNSGQKVGTTKISPIYRLNSEFKMKRPLIKISEVNRSYMVELPGIAPGSEK